MLLLKVWLLFLFMYMYVFACMCAHMCVGARPLELESQVIVSHLTWILGAKLSFLQEQKHSLNHGVISLAQISAFLLVF